MNTYSQYGINYVDWFEPVLNTPITVIDTNTYPLTPYANGWLVFNGVGNKQFARAGNYNPAEFIYSVTDSFTIQTRIQIQTRKAMWIAGIHNGSAGSWILGFNSNSGNTLEFYLNGWKNIKVLGATDTLWQTVLIKFRKSDNELNIWRNDTLLSTTTAFSYTSSDNANALTIGHAQMPASTADPTTGDGNPTTHFFSGKMDYLYIHKYFNGVDSAVIFNFNEGVGQNMYDSLTYTVIDRASPDAVVASNHICNGWNPGQDSQDVSFSKGLRKNTTNVTALGTGLWLWLPAISSFGQPFTNGLATWKTTQLVPTTAFNRVNVTLGTWTHNGDTASDVAQWNGTTWSKIGNNGTFFSGGSVTQVYPFGDSLFAGGSFTNAGSLANADYVAYYKGGTDFDTCSKGFDNAVYCFTTFNGKVLGGGAFNASGAITITSSVAQWNYTSWSAIGTSDIGEVWALEVLNGSLYAGTSGGLYKFVSTDWVLQSDLSGATIFCLQSFNGQLWYGGTGGTLGYWDGSAHQMGTVSGFTNHIVEFCTDGRDLYVCGSFYRINYLGVNTVVNKIARWNKLQWSAVNYGADERPESIEMYQGKLAFSGDFFTVDAVSVNNICLITLP